MRKFHFHFQSHVSQEYLLKKDLPLKLRHERLRFSMQSNFN